MERRPQRKPAGRPLVLIVDDHDEMLALCALALSATGFDVVPARDRQDAYYRAQALDPDIIVTAVSAPPADGWSFVQDLKQNPGTRDIPVVVLTDRLDPSLRARAEREGCAAMVGKPYRPEQLAFALRTTLAHRGNLLSTNQMARI